MQVPQYAPVAPIPQAPIPQPIPQVADDTSAQKFEYKVLSSNDGWFAGRFDPIMLEQYLNAYAKQGWRVIGCSSAHMADYSGYSKHPGFLAILEKEK